MWNKLITKWFLPFHFFDVSPFFFSSHYGPSLQRLYVTRGFISLYFIYIHTYIHTYSSEEWSLFSDPSTQIIPQKCLGCYLLPCRPGYQNAAISTWHEYSTYHSSPRHPIVCPIKSFPLAYHLSHRKQVRLPPRYESKVLIEHSLSHSLFPSSPGDPFLIHATSPRFILAMHKTWFFSETFLLPFPSLPTNYRSSHACTSLFLTMYIRS